MLLEIIILILAVPVGYLIARMANDELVSGRKWFRILVIAGVFFGGWSFLIGENVTGFSCGFIVISTFVSLIKSYDKKWTKKRI